MLILKDGYVFLKYFGQTYSAKLEEGVVETLAHILNGIKDNAQNIYHDVYAMLNIMEPPQSKQLRFDGLKYVAC